MTEAIDHLKSYVGKGNERAFRALVDQHLGMVFGIAMRRTGDRGLSEEIAQNVFTALARKAGEIRAAAALPAWLHRATVFECSKAIRGESRRKKRMEKLIEINALEGDGLAVWKHAASDLDEAVDQLPAADREILFQRFYEDKSFSEIASATGKSEAASQKQASRALQKLAELMRGRGFAVPATALAAGFSLEFSHGAPANLAASISTSALATAGTSVAVATATKSGILAAMSFSKSTAVGIAVALLLVTAFSGAGFLTGRSAAKSENIASAKASEKPKSLPSAIRSDGGGTAGGNTSPVSNPDKRGSVQEIIEAAAAYFVTGLHTRESVGSPEDLEKANRLIARLEEGEIEEARAVAAALDHPGFVKFRIDAEITGHWARFDGEAAAEYLRGEANSFILGKVLVSWCEHSPTEAYAWFRESVANGGIQYGHAERDSLLRKTITAWANTDVTGAIEEFAKMDYDEQRQLTHSFGRLALDAQSRGPFLAAIEKFPDQRLRAELIEDAVNDWCEVDHVSAAAWFDTVEFESLEVGFEPAVEVFEYLFERDAAAAVDWLWPKAPEHMKEVFVDQFVREEWAEIDADGAAAWLEEKGFEPN